MTASDRKSAALADVDAERAVLGALLTGEADPDDVAACVGELEREAFSTDAHRAIFDACRSLHEDGLPVDDVLAGTRLAERGDLSAAGGRAGLLELVHQVPTTANLRHYLGIVRESWQRRRRQRLLREALAVVEDPQAPIEQGDRALAALAREQSSVSDAPPPTVLEGRWQPLGDDWLDERPPERRYLLRTKLTEGHGFVSEPAGFIPQSRVAMLAGAGSAGKSFALAQLALCVSTGRDWLGFEVVEPGRVLLALGEEEPDEARRRFYHAADAMHLTAAERRLAAERIVCLSLAGVPVALTFGLDELRAVSRGSRLDLSAGTYDTPFASELHERIGQGGPWKLLAFDPVSRFAGPDVEIDNAAATRFVEVLERFTSAPGNPTVIVAHHMAKVARVARTDVNAARGSSALTDGVRLAINLEVLDRLDGAPDLPDLARLRTVKSNYARRPDPVWLARGPHGVLRLATAAERRAYADALEESEGERRRSRRKESTAKPGASSATGAERRGFGE